jgi:hypothetical protein
MSTATNAPLTIGDQAPDLSYLSFQGAQHHLSEFWADSPALLIWLRHFG